MKLVECINCLRNREGAEVFFASLVRQLFAKKSVELYVIVLHDDINDSFSFLKELLDDNHFFVCHKAPGLDLKAASLFRKIVNKINPDIIHTHLSCLLTYYFAFGSTKKQWKVVHTLHSVADQESTALGKIVIRKLIRRHNLHLVGISDLITVSAKKLYRHDDISTVFNGIDLRGSNASGPTSYAFVCVARFAALKNHLRLLDYFAKYVAAFPEAKMLFVGDGELRPAIEKKIDALGLSNLVVLSGLVDDVYPFLYESETFVLLSEYEGNPISLLEAMDAGLPIIASNVGGIPDIVTDGENGFLVDCHNESECVDRMMRLHDRTLFLQISKNNSARASRYSIECCAENYLGVFEGLYGKI